MTSDFFIVFLWTYEMYKRERKSNEYKCKIITQGRVKQIDFVTILC